MFRIYDFSVFKQFVQNAADSKSHYELVGYHEENRNGLFFYYTLFSAAGSFWFMETFDNEKAEQVLSFLKKHWTISNIYVDKKNHAINLR